MIHLTNKAVNHNIAFYSLVLYCSGFSRKGRGAWGWSLQALSPDEALHPLGSGSGACAEGAYQSAELQAAIQGLTSLRKVLEAYPDHPGLRILVVTDSDYVWRNVTEVSLQFHQQRGWSTSNRGFEQNAALWDELVAKLEALSQYVSGQATVTRMDWYYCPDSALSGCKAAAALARQAFEEQGEQPS